jgi:succinylglutamic semialdehyde dehydrogenase
MKALQSLNPATGEVIWEGPAAGPQEVAAAVQGARRAFDTWRQTTFGARLEVIERFRGVLERKKEDMAQTIARETGKVLWDARAEVAAMISKGGDLKPGLHGAHRPARGVDRRGAPCGAPSSPWRGGGSRTL